MTNTFKFSTFVIKLLLFSFVLASFALSSVRAAQNSENEKMVLETVRLSLWYQGIHEVQGDGQSISYDQTEELQKAMLRHDRERNSNSMDARK